MGLARAAGTGTGAANGFVITMTVVAPGGEHLVAGADLRAELPHQLCFAVGDRGVGEPQAQPIESLCIQAQVSQGPGTLPRPLGAQALGGPEAGPRVTAFTVGDRNQQQAGRIAGQAGQQSATHQHLVVRVRGDHHQAPAHGQDQFPGQGRHGVQGARCLPLGQ